MPAEPLDPFAAFRLDDRVALVTGASAGLGARFARVLHAAGATVVAYSTYPSGRMRSLFQTPSWR